LTDEKDTLALLRSEIDNIDEHIVLLLNKRAQLVTSVGEWKHSNNFPIFDPSRENIILEKIQKNNKGPLPNSILTKIFSDLVSNFRQWELMSQEINNLESKINWLKTKKIGIIGLGLLGFSVALRFKKMCPDVQISGYDPDLSHKNKLSSHLELKNSFENVLKNSDILILATPALVTIDLIKNYKTQLAPLDLILDLSSTKFLICNMANDIKNFIGGHPLAGKAQSGANSAEDHIFIGSPFVLCPQNDCSKELLLRAENIVSLLGSIPYTLNPEFHDEMLALTSHLPQMIATNLTCMSSELYQLMGDPFLFGPAFSEMTRCASSNLKMWEDIISTNHENIMNIISKFIKQLSDFQISLEKGDIKYEFSEAIKFKNTLIKK
jgi:prephenate dehydrogenase